MLAFSTECASRSKNLPSGCSYGVPTGRKHLNPCKCGSVLGNGKTKTTLAHGADNARPTCANPDVAVRIRTVGQTPMEAGWSATLTFHDSKPQSKLGLDSDSVIHRGLNSLFAAQIAFGGLH